MCPLVWIKSKKHEFISGEYYKRISISVPFLASEIYIYGTKVVNKNNFKDHINKNQTHITAVPKLGEIWNT